MCTKDQHALEIQTKIGAKLAVRPSHGGHRMAGIAHRAALPNPLTRTQISYNAAKHTFQGPLLHWQNDRLVSPWHSERVAGLAVQK